MFKKNKFVIAILGGIILVLVAVLVYQNVNNINSNVLSKEEITKKIIEIVGKDVGDATQVSVSSIEQEGFLYKVALSVMGQNYNSYATLDGEYLFPQSINLNPPEPKEIPKIEKADVGLFVMSYCPYGNQAENTMIPVVELLKDKADISLHYVIYSNYGSGYPEYCLDKENKYCSMHGIQEVNQDVRELCVQKYQKEKLWDFVKEMNANSTSQDADSKWESIAKKLGIDVGKIKTCQQDEATTLLDQEILLTAKNYQVQDPASHQNAETETISGSPTLIINDTYYDGERSTAAYQNAICNAFTVTPGECNTIIEESTSTSANVDSGSCQ